MQALKEKLLALAKSHGLTILLALIILAVLLQRLVFWSLHPLLVSSDQSVYLQMAELILQGKIPYRDFFDFNPPLIMYLNLIPVTVAHAARWPTPLGLSMTVMALLFVSTVYSAILLYRRRDKLPWSIFFPVLLAFVYFHGGIDQDMGQREHIFTILFFPFMLIRGVRHFGAPVGRVESVVWALACGTILCLKPHFFFAFFLTELGFFIESKNWRALFAIEIWAMMLPLLVYGAAFFCLPGEARSLFFDQIMPVYIWGNSWASKCFTHMLVGYSYFYEPFYQVTAALVLSLFFLNSRLRSPWLTPFVFATLAFMLNYIQGNQAWTYRLLPMALFARLLLALVGGMLLHALTGRLSRLSSDAPAVLAPCVTVALAILVGVDCESRIRFYIDEYKNSPRYDLAALGFKGQNPRSDFDSTFFSMVENSKPGDSVVHIGSGIRPGFPCQLQGARKPGSRYLYFMITMILTAMKNRPDMQSKWSAIEKTVVENLGEDILKNKPTLVYLQDWPVDEALEKHHFSKRYLRAYSKIGHIDATDIYKRTGQKVDLGKYSPYQRAELVLPVLLGSKTAARVAADTHIPVEVINDWIERARDGLILKLRDRSSDREDELKGEIEKLADDLWKRTREADALRADLEKAQKQAQKPAQKQAK